MKLDYPWCSTCDAPHDECDPDDLRYVCMECGGAVDPDDDVAPWGHPMDHMHKWCTP